MVVKASDIRVSERVCLSSVTLNKFSTVYNDLIDEVGNSKLLRCINKGGLQNAKDRDLTLTRLLRKLTEYLFYFEKSPRLPKQ